ncbi:MAG TPA: FAD-dependent oxidoreductase, partial [Armatimonadota bacterium]|nr:FAD-dependent oxidoreductase [Armatimonadota bacterium]
MSIGEQIDDAPVFGDYDVVVCGGGPAGIAAAVAAGNAGARTLLIERLGYVGGMAALMGSFCDSHGGPVFDELARRLIELGAAHWSENPERYRPPGRLGFKPDTLKAVAMELLVEAGVEVLLDSIAEAPAMDGGAVVGVLMGNKAGRMAVRAKVVVDCTADADLAAGAGARFLKGDLEDGRMQHANFRVRLTGIDSDRWQRERPGDEELLALLREAHQSGELITPPGLFRAQPGAFPYDPLTGELSGGNWEIQGVDASDPVAVSRTVAECTVAAIRMVRFCRAHLPGHEQCEIQRLPLSLGTRESRRVVGGYILTGEDVVAGAKFPDAIARGW